MPSVRIQGAGKLTGEYQPPGDKSISHRAVMFGALANGRSHYSNFLEAEDCLCTAQAFRDMGVQVDIRRGVLIVDGVGMSGLNAPQKDLYLGNSGTSMRLLMGILAGQRFQATLTGDPSLSGRPMQRVTKPLKQMGAQIKGRDQENFAPLSVRGGRLQGIEYHNKLRSAQVKSAILLAGMYAEGLTRVVEDVPSRDHTERFLRASGARFSQEGGTLSIQKTDQIRPFEAVIPSDISSAAFFMVGTAIAPGSSVTLHKVSLNPTRTGIIEVLKRMGCRLTVNQTQLDPEPMGDIHISYSGPLKGTAVRGAEIPSLIDELPILMTAMALAEGESLISGAQELRVKETDRIQSMVTNLKAIGANIEELADGCIIRGVERFHGASVQSFGDHRTAMSMAIAALCMNGDVEIQDTACISTSFPGFFEALSGLKNGIDSRL